MLLPGLHQYWARVNGSRTCSYERTRSADLPAYAAATRYPVLICHIMLMSYGSPTSLLPGTHISHIVLPVW
eukprot:524212-Rhodomonas_salina.3